MVRGPQFEKLCPRETRIYWKLKVEALDRIVLYGELDSEEAAVLSWYTLRGYVKNYRVCLALIHN